MSKGWWDLGVLRHLKAIGGRYMDIAALLGHMRRMDAKLETDIFLVFRELEIWKVLEVVINLWLLRAGKVR